MKCLDNIVQGLHPVVDPNSTNEVLRQEKIKKANGYLALGIVVATAAVALAALGLTITLLLSPAGITLLALAAPVFLVGYTITALSINYKGIVNNHSNYWDGSIQYPREYQMQLDLTNGTLFHKILSDPKVKESCEKLTQARMNLRNLQQGFARKLQEGLLV